MLLNQPQSKLGQTCANRERKIKWLGKGSWTFTTLSWVTGTQTNTKFTGLASAINWCTTWKEIALCGSPDQIFSRLVSEVCSHPRWPELFPAKFKNWKLGFWISILWGSEYRTSKNWKHLQYRRSLMEVIFKKLLFLIISFKVVVLIIW